MLNLEAFRLAPEFGIGRQQADIDRSAAPQETADTVPLFRIDVRLSRKQAFGITQDLDIVGNRAARLNAPRSKPFHGVTSKSLPHRRLAERNGEPSWRGRERAGPRCTGLTGARPMSSPKRLHAGSVSTEFRCRDTRWKFIVTRSWGGGYRQPDDRIFETRGTAGPFKSRTNPRSHSPAQPCD